MNKVMIDKAVFALCDVASTDIRSGITRVCIERDIAVATDGSMLVAVDLPIKAADGWESILLDADELRKVGKAIGKKKEAWVCAPGADEWVVIEADGGGASFKLKAQDDRFPDWRPTIRGGFGRHGGATEWICLNASYIEKLATIAGACVTYSHDTPPRALTFNFHGNGGTTILSPSSDRFVAFLMPIRENVNDDRSKASGKLVEVHDRWLRDADTTRKVA